MQYRKLTYLLILPVILVGCGFSVRLYSKVASDPAPSPQKLAILAPFVAANYPLKETFIIGKSDTTILHDTSTQIAIYYDTINKRYDSIIYKQIAVKRLIMRIDTIKVKEIVDCFAISQRLAVAEAKVVELKEWRKWFIILAIILTLIFTIVSIIKKW